MKTMPAIAKVRAKDPIHRALCDEWKARRLELGLTQQNVADALGITQPAYAAIEIGNCPPTLTIIQRVSKALKLKPSIQLAKAG